MSSSTVSPVANQYSLINRASGQANATTTPAVAATLAINCKFGALCKNYRCMYAHPRLPLKSQLRWTPGGTSAMSFSKFTSVLSNPAAHISVNEQLINVRAANDAAAMAVAAADSSSGGMEAKQTLESRNEATVV